MATRMGAGWAGLLTEEVLQYAELIEEESVQ
jgi:hypothetical protein